jgi:hypothetical protein
VNANEVHSSCERVCEEAIVEERKVVVFCTCQWLVGSHYLKAAAICGLRDPHS